MGFVLAQLYAGDPAALKKVLDSDAQLKHLLNSFVEVEDSPENGVAFLEKDLAAKLVEQAAPQNVKVTLDGDLKTQIEQLYQSLGSTEAHEVVSGRLAAELSERRWERRVIPCAWGSRVGW